MNHISVKHLKAVDACADQVNLFKEIFGESVSFDSKEEAKALAKKYAQDFDFGFIGEKVFGEAYVEAETPLWKAYMEARAPFLKTYKEAVAPLWKALFLKTYKGATPLKVYGETEAPLWKAYKKAEAPLWKAYKEARAEVFAEMWRNK